MFGIFNEHHNVSFPGGVIQDMLTRRMIDKNGLTINQHSQINQTANYSYASQQVDLTQGPGAVHVIYNVQEDFYYHLQGIRVSYPDYTDQTKSPELRFKYFEPTRGRNLTPCPVAIPFRLMTTPAETVIRRTMAILNLTYLPSSLIQFEITGHTGTAPEYVDIMLEGLRIPKNEQYHF